MRYWIRTKVDFLTGLCNMIIDLFLLLGLIFCYITFMIPSMKLCEALPVTVTMTDAWWDCYVGQTIIFYLMCCNIHLAWKIKILSTKKIHCIQLSLIDIDDNHRVSTKVSSFTVPMMLF